MKYYKRLIITMLFICLFILGGCGVFQNDNEVLQSADPSEGVITESGNEILQSSDLSEDVLIESDSDEERKENNITEEYNGTEMGGENKTIAVYNDGEIRRNPIGLREYDGSRGNSGGNLTWQSYSLQ